MCGRFVSATPPDQLAAYFGVQAQGETLLEPSYNVAPTNDVFTVVQVEEERRLEAFHWGLVPFWAKDPKIGNRMINARAETVASKNAYRAAFKKRRCLVPADSFYEWVAVDGHKKKQPMRIYRPDGEPFAFAGLWESWRPKDDDGEYLDEDPLQSCTIITGRPNEKMADIHERMPVILPPTVWERWLDPTFDDAEALTALLVPAPSELIEFHPVSLDVNNPRVKGEYLIEPVDALQPVDAEGKLL